MSTHGNQARTPAGVSTGGQFAATSRAESPVHLHVGIGPHATPLVEIIGDHAIGIENVHNTGDSWDVWGERGKAGGTRHVVFEAPDTQSATMIAGVLEGTGVLQRADDGHDTLWSVTNPENWNEVIATDATTETREDDRERGRRSKEAYVELASRPIAEALVAASERHPRGLGRLVRRR